MPEGIERKTSREREACQPTRRVRRLRRRGLSIEQLEPRLVLAGINMSTSQVSLGSYINDTTMGVNAVAIGDLNNDGKADLIASWARVSAPATGTPAVYIALGNGNGTFATATKLTDNGSAISFGSGVGATVGDVTGDGNLDVITLTGATVPDTIRVFRGLGTGVFHSWYSLTLPRYATDLAVMDVTGDGALDLVVTHAETQVISVYPRIAAGFGAAVDTSLSGWTPYTLRPANLNGDQLRDAVIGAKDSSGAVALLALQATSSGSFSVASAPLPSPLLGASVISVAVGEINGDGRDEVAVAVGNSSSPTTDAVRIYRNSGSGTFSASSYLDFSVSDYPSSFPGFDDVPTGVALADFNKDGRGDIFVTKHASQTSIIYLQNPDGSFASSAVAGLMGYGNPCVADINGDATPDVMVGQLSFNRVSAFLVTRQNPVSVPSAPTGVSGTAGNTQISLSWTAPTSNGGASITDYVIQYKTTAATTWTTFNDGTSTATSAVVTGLTNGTGYVFQVAAVNSAGTGTYSAASSTITPVAPTSVPSAPTGVSGTAGNTQISLSWTAPTSNGGASITDYVIQYKTTAATTWTTFNDGTSTATSAVVTGLTNGTGYVFQVAAVNSAGTGTYSAASSTITPVAPTSVPSAPTGVSGTAGNAQVSLSWTAPTSNGGASITDYIVEYSSNNGSTWTAFNDGASTATSTTVTGLQPGTGYIFRVAAKNAAGTGAYSSSSGIITPVTTPSAPTGLTGTAGNSQVSLSWTAPSSNGGTPITDYIVEYSTNNGSTWTAFPHSASAASSIVVTGLPPGTGHIFRVAAKNSVGVGGYSTSSSTITTLVVAPGAPTAVSCTAGDGQVILSWTAPSSTGGSAVSDYVVEYSENNGLAWVTFNDGVSTSTSATVTSLKNGTGYIFRVAAKNSVGVGGYSSSSGIITPVTTPGAPTGVTGTAGNSQVSLSWTAPSSNGGTPITDYIVEYSTNNGSTWTAFPHSASAASSIVVTGLQAGTGHIFRVAAKNSVGVGGYSTSSSTITPVTTPGAPTNVTGTPGYSQVSLSWTAPLSTGGAAITDYVVEYSTNNGSAWTVYPHSASAATSIVVSGLQSGAGYIFRVAAQTSVGQGIYSAYSSTITPLSPIPSAPKWLTAYADKTSITLTWVDDSAAKAQYYKVYYRNTYTTHYSKWTYTTTCTATSILLTGLETGRRHVFRVEAVNQSGTSAASETVASPEAVSGTPRQNQRPALSSTVALSLKATDLSGRVPVGEDGIAISDLLPTGVSGSFAVDGDGGAVGVAIVSKAAVGSVWYTTNSGAQWNQVGSVSEAAALVLFATPSTRLFYQASAAAGNNTGLQSGVVSMKAWDRTDGVSNGAIVDTRSTFLPAAVGISSGLAASGDEFMSLPSRRLIVDTWYDSSSRKSDIVFIDNSLPWKPRVINQWSSRWGHEISALAVSPDQNTLYAISYTGGLLIVDISNVYSPQLVARVDKSLYYARDICVTADGRYVLIADEHTVWVADVSDPASVTWNSLQPQTSMMRYHRIQVSRDGLVAFAARFESSGVEVLDISVKDKPRRVTTLTSTPTWAVAAAPNGRMVYVGDGSSLKIFDATNPASSRLVATLNMPAAIGSIRALSDGRTVLATCGALGVQVVEVVGGVARLLGSIAGSTNVTQLAAAYDDDTLSTLGGGSDPSYYGNSWRTYSLRNMSAYSFQWVAGDVLVESTEPSRTISIAAGQAVVDPIVTSGNGVVTKRGAGVLILDKPNSHTGGTVVEAGEVIIRNPAALGSGALEVRAGARVTLDVVGSEIAVGALKLSDGGRLDLGYGRVAFHVSAGSVQDGLNLAKVQDLLRRAYEAGWAGIDGFETRTAGLVIGGGLAYVDNGGGSITVGYAAKGDTNLDGVVDVLDAANFLSAGKMDTSMPSTWSEGDFNYDGVFDLLDVADFVGSGLFENGSYMPSQATQSWMPAMTMSAVDAAFIAFAADSTTGTTTSKMKKSRFRSQT